MTILWSLKKHWQSPYRLGGWSFGGTLAYEIAVQLAASGEQIETLLLIDSYNPLVTSRAKYVKNIISNYLYKHGLAQDSEESKLLSLEIDHNENLLANYKPSPYDFGKVILLKAEKPEESWDKAAQSNPFNGWEMLVKSELVIDSICTTHIEMFDPTVVEKTGLKIAALLSIKPNSIWSNRNYSIVDRLLVASCLEGNKFLIKQAANQGANLSTIYEGKMLHQLNPDMSNYLHLLRKQFETSRSTAIDTEVLLSETTP